MLAADASSKRCVPYQHFHTRPSWLLGMDARKGCIRFCLKASSSGPGTQVQRGRSAQEEAQPWAMLSPFLCYTLVLTGKKQQGYQQNSPKVLPVIKVQFQWLQSSRDSSAANEMYLDVGPKVLTLRGTVEFQRWHFVPEVNFFLTNGELLGFVHALDSTITAIIWLHSNLNFFGVLTTRTLKTYDFVSHDT